MAVKLWASRSYTTGKCIVTFGYWVGALPVKWNTEHHTMEPLTSYFDLGRWIFTIIYNTIWQIAMALSFGLKFVATEDKTKFLLENKITISVVGLSISLILVHIHTAWKYKEFASFITRAAKFYEHFQNKFAKEEERLGYTIEDTISGIIKISFLVAIIGLSSLALLGYLFRCRLHVLLYLLPICKSNYPLGINILIKILLSIFQLHYFVIQIVGLVLYVDLFAAVVLMGVYIAEQMKEMGESRRRTTLLVLEPMEWFLCYRCLDLIVKELNGCIGEVFMPFHMLFAASVPAIFIMILVRYDVEPATIGAFIIIFIMVILYYRFLIGRGSNFSQISESALKSMGWKMNSKYLIRRYRSCQVLKPNVGGLFPLKRETVATMYQSSVDLTANLLLLQ